MSRALVFGVSGQDGAYLARNLIGRGYQVYGASRDAGAMNTRNLDALGITPDVRLLSCSLADFRSVLAALATAEPAVVYNLGGQTSVGLSFGLPVETFESIMVATVNILEAIRFIDAGIRFYNAGSSECFGNTPEHGADEETAFHPRSPYGVAKAGAHWAVVNYRESYNLHACTGILFNHESPLRQERFVTRKVTEAAKRIAAGDSPRLKLGDLSIVRDWGWAPDYVEAMVRMLEREQAEDFVIATGIASSLEEFVAAAFGYYDLDWREWVETDPSLYRPADIRFSRGVSAKARRLLRWEPSLTMPHLVARLCAGRPDPSQE